MNWKQVYTDEDAIKYVIRDGEKVYPSYVAADIISRFGVCYCGSARDFTDLAKKAQLLPTAKYHNGRRGCKGAYLWSMEAIMYILDMIIDQEEEEEKRLKKKMKKVGGVRKVMKEYKKLDFHMELKDFVENFEKLQLLT